MWLATDVVCSMAATFAVIPFVTSTRLVSSVVRLDFVFSKLVTSSVSFDWISVVVAVTVFLIVLSLESTPTSLV